jgi:hypothetical protein
MRDHGGSKWAPLQLANTAWAIQVGHSPAATKEIVVGA